ncbi:alpha-L-rhamnosidase C-terminal domain-containing protein [Chthonomonas calidirosea]|uniref:alpha-L-rhamnosidase-related protein n=1 Tax=Chthonomonas calidirosea TaxID=454171 RepID=UPI0006EC5EE7|nr:alpha-L-rhamnosidase C-terminal domain-containing protein [Chthonomonas calidirosea]CEK19002.1 glycogen debranching enzyme [Chthonomonas calidirosea]
MGRISLFDDPYAQLHADKGWPDFGTWPCRWITLPNPGAPPFVVAYRCRFELNEPATLRFHVTADERYDLFLDGVRIGRGSERGDVQHWFFETYEETLSAGPHILVARVWTLGPRAPYAQMSLHHGFLLSPQEEAFYDLIGTGRAVWEAKRLGGYTFIDPLAAWGTGDNLLLEGTAFSWGFERGEGEGWQPVETLEPGVDARRYANDHAPVHLLLPAALPPMMERCWERGRVRHVAAVPSLQTSSLPVRQADHLIEEAIAWQQLWSAQQPLIVPPNTRRRVLVDLEDYVCAYPEIVVSGGRGATLRLHWQESLFNEPDAKTKGDRNAIEGKYFVTLWHLKEGVGDTFLPDGGRSRRFDTLWWQAGRYLEIAVETRDEPLLLESLRLHETRYPLEMESQFSCSDARLETVTPLALRALQMCAHETYMDCPYYEQLMYVGDTRLEALVTYVLTRDDRLPRKALQLFDASRLLNGLTQSRYPSRVQQIIPPFSLWWVAMIYDYALWRGDPSFIRSLLPGARSVLEYFLAHRGADGLMRGPLGWNFLDWVPAWRHGTPPDGQWGASAPLNWQLVMALKMMEALERWLDEPELAARYKRLAEELAHTTDEHFWNESRGLYADDLAHTSFSEHAQCLALLSGLVPQERYTRLGEMLFTSSSTSSALPDLHRTTISFTHYLFEAYRILGRPDALLERLALWFDLKALGLCTTIEMPEPTRSDCHGWGAHPLYHYFATLLGIRPARFGFDRVRIAPQPGPLNSLAGVLVHPKGSIEADFTFTDGKLQGRVALPEGVKGTLIWGGREQPLFAGTQEVRL